MTTPRRSPPGLSSRDNLSAVIPILSKSGSFWKNGYWLHAVAVGAVGVLMTAAADANDIAGVFRLFGEFAMYVNCALVFHLCGKRLLFWPMVAVFFVSAILMATPLFAIVATPFRGAHVMANLHATDFFSAFAAYFSGAGLAEELYKALPLLALAGLAVARRRGELTRWPAAFTLSEPLDGIALGVASGAAFTLNETLGQYVLDKYNLEGLITLIVRVVPDLCGHLAYAGYFGYFIGLAVLKPKSAPLYLAVGFGTSAALHGLWDALLQVRAPNILLALLAIASAAFLFSAILRARRISPTRITNFASAAYSTPSPAAAPVSRPKSTPSALPPQGHPASAPSTKEPPSATPAAASRRTRRVVLAIGELHLEPKAGGLILPRMLGAAGAGRGRDPVGGFEKTADSPSGFALRNLGDIAWEITTADGDRALLARDERVILAPGAVIDFKGVKGAVRDA